MKDHCRSAPRGSSVVLSSSSSALELSQLGGKVARLVVNAASWHGSFLFPFACLSLQHIQYRSLLLLERLPKNFSHQEHHILTEVLSRSRTKDAVEFTARAARQAGVQPETRVRFNAYGGSSKTLKAEDVVVVKQFPTHVVEAIPPWAIDLNRD